MKSLSQQLLLASALAVGSATVLAQPAHAPADSMAPQARAMRPHTPPDSEQMRQRMAERRAHMLEQFKAKLKITPEQESAWNAFAASIQPPNGAQARFDPEALAKMTTPQRIDALEKLQSERAERMHRRGEAIKALYAQLTPYQQGLFDAQRMPHHFGPHMGHGMMRKGGHPGMDR